MPELSHKAQELADHYATVLGLYKELEQLSKQIFEAFENNSVSTTLTDVLKAKIDVVTRIQVESKAITALKNEMQLSGAERDAVKRAEEQLTELVKHVIENEDHSHRLLQKQGMKIPRSGSPGT